MKINYENTKILFDIIFCFIDGQDKDKPTFTRSEALEMIKQRDATMGR